MLQGLRYLAMTCTLALLAAPAAAASRDRTKPAPAVQARDKAQLAFQRDLVSVLAPGGDAQLLLGAALLARPLFNQPPENGYHRLLERAVQADGADAALYWAQLADCDAKADACPNPDALQHLLERAPDNAAAWLVKLGADARDMKQDAVRDDLAKAAAAKLYDDYTGSSLKALANAVVVLPPPPAALDPAQPGGASAMQAVMVFALGSAQPQPSLPLVAKLCENAGDDGSIKADCLRLGKTLEWGSSPLARSLGLHLREVLAADPAQQQDARDARRNLIWQVQNFNRLLDQARSDPELARQLLALARNGGTETSLQLGALRGRGIPVEAPAGWQPHPPAGQDAGK